MKEIFPANSEKGVLYVGFDDSNHLGRVKAEIVVGVFSFNCDDAVVRFHSNRRKHRETEEWIKAGRDYRYTILTGSQLVGRHGKYNSTNLPFAAPYLVRNYLSSLSEVVRQRIEKIGLYFDGQINADNIEHLKFCFKDFPELDIAGFIKKSRVGRNRKSSKRPICPEVVYRADTIAHDLFRRLQPASKTSLDKLAEDPLFVRI